MAQLHYYQFRRAPDTLRRIVEESSALAGMRGELAKFDLRVQAPGGRGGKIVTTPSTYMKVLVALHCEGFQTPRLGV